MSEIAKNFFTRDFNKIEKDLQTDFVRNIFNEINSEFWEYLKSEEFNNDRKIIKKNRKAKNNIFLKIPGINKKVRKESEIFKWVSENYKNFENKIKELVLDEKNIWTDFLTSYLFLEEKERNIRTYARIFYWDKYYSIISQKTNNIWFNDDIVTWMIDWYRWNLSANIIRWQSYILNKLLYWEWNFWNWDIHWEINSNFEIKIEKFLEKYDSLIRRLWIKYTKNKKWDKFEWKNLWSIEKSFYYHEKNKKWEWVTWYSKDLLRILWWKEFVKSMWWKSYDKKNWPENVFQIMRKVYEYKFWNPPPMFMDYKFKEQFFYINEKWEKITPRWVSILENSKNIIKKNN